MKICNIKWDKIKMFILELHYSFFSLQLSIVVRTAHAAIFVSWYLSEMVAHGLEVSRVGAPMVTPSRQAAQQRAWVVSLIFHTHTLLSSSSSFFLLLPLPFPFLRLFHLLFFSSLSDFSFPSSFSSFPLSHFFFLSPVWPVFILSLSTYSPPPPL